jgi:hypothetical protein
MLKTETRRKLVQAVSKLGCVSAKDEMPKEKEEEAKARR